MYDYLDILGVPPDAGAALIRRAESRRTARRHPDLDVNDDDRPPGSAMSRVRPPSTPDPADAALDFLDMTLLVPRIQDAFFARSA